MKYIAAIGYNSIIIYIHSAKQINILEYSSIENGEEDSLIRKILILLKAINEI